MIRWLIQPGDVVKRGQDLLEVMTDKATMTVPSPFVGTINALKAEAGRIIKVGEPLLKRTMAAVESMVDGGPYHAGHA